MAAQETPTGETVPAVSVVMPVKNGARWLAESIDSVRDQTSADWELVVVDNGSTDATPEIIRAAAAGDRRIVPMAEPRPGIVAALNTGLAKSRAPLIARLDADDIALPRRLEMQVAFLERRPEIGVVGSAAEEVDERGSRIRVRRPPTDGTAITDLLSRGNPMIHPAVMMRAGLVRAAGSYREGFPAAEDYDLWLRLARLTAFANLNEPLIRYRINPAGESMREQVRQAFSARLALAVAARERSTGEIAAAGPAIDGPGSVERNASFIEEARLFRLLALADPAASADSDLHALLLAGALPPFPLVGIERRLARRAAQNVLRFHGKGSVATRLKLFRLLRRLSRSN